MWERARGKVLECLQASHCVTVQFGDHDAGELAEILIGGPGKRKGDDTHKPQPPRHTDSHAHRRSARSQIVQIC
jgi:hypothetical protein